jgi:hypothetical protein
LDDIPPPEQDLQNFTRTHIMKTSYAATIALAIATLAAGQAMAANTPVQGKTREQVRAELMESRRNTDSRDSIEPVTGLSFRELSATPVAGQGKTRAQVRAEVLDVRRNTDSRDSIEPVTGLSFRELSATPVAGQGKTRDQVRAELTQAQHSRDSGDVVESTTGMTFRELNPGRYAAKASS